MLVGNQHWVLFEGGVKEPGLRLSDPRPLMGWQKRWNVVLFMFCPFERLDLKRSLATFRSTPSQEVVQLRR